MSHLIFSFIFRTRMWGKTKQTTSSKISLCMKITLTSDDLLKYLKIMKAPDFSLEARTSKLSLTPLRSHSTSKHTKLIALNFLLLGHLLIPYDLQTSLLPFSIRFNLSLFSHFSESKIFLSNFPDNTNFHAFKVDLTRHRWHRDPDTGDEQNCPRFPRQIVSELSESSSWDVTETQIRMTEMSKMT